MIYRQYRARRFLVIGMLFLVGVFVTSCAWNPFDQPPDPRITVTEGPPYGVAPLTLTFDISGSTDPDGTIVAFTLDFGDGTAPVEGTDITQPIEHTYQTPGSYFAKLTVTDNGGASASAMLAVGVYSPS